MSSLVIRIILVAALLAAGVAGGWHYTLHRIPYQVMDEVFALFERVAGGANSIHHSPRYGPYESRIPRSNPDIVTSMCVYDLATGPVRIAGEAWPDYWSLSLYADNTDNFFVVNDRDLETARFDIVILPQGGDGDIFGEATHTVTAPSQKGVMLIRRFVPSATRLEAARANQRATTCAPVTAPAPS